MLDQHWRSGVERGLRPLGTRLRQAGFTADQITVLGLAASVFTGIAIGTGHFLLAAAGLAVSGLTDVLDGAVAKSGGTDSARGAFFDSVADRLSDAMVLGGVAWYLAGTDPHASVLAFAVAALSMVVSYERAKAEALGFEARGGLMERAERMFLLGVALVFDILVPVLWILLAASALTVLQRFVKVWGQATRASTGSEVRRPAWWVSMRPASTSESRLARWRFSARPPGERGPSRRRALRTLASDTGDGEGDASRRTRWWAGSAAGTGVRSSLRRWRGRTRP